MFSTSSLLACKCFATFLGALWVMWHGQPLKYKRKQSSIRVMDKNVKRCSENMQQIYSRTLILKCKLNKVAKQLYLNHFRHGCSPVTLLHIFRTFFPKNTSGWILLYLESLRAIIFVFSEFRKLIFAEVLSTPTEAQLREGSDVSNNWDIFSFNAL